MLVNYFLILITLLLISGLVIDAGVLEWRQLQLQTAADAAAQEASFQLARGDTAWSTAGQAQASANGAVNGSSGVTVTLSNPPTSGAYSGDKLSVQATVSKSVNNLFMAFVNGGRSTIGASAVAREIPTCIWIATGVLNLASANINASCGAYIGTANGTSASIDGFSNLRTWRTRIVGPASGAGGGGTIVPAPHFVSAAKSDPLAYVTSPGSTFTCDYNSSSVSGITMSIGPGKYCGGMTVSNSTLTLSPGLYIVADGMTINNSTINATSGVTFYFTKHNSTGYTSVNFSSSTLYIKAPSSSSAGGITGIAMFADRNWVAHGSYGINFINSNVTSDGVWYIPNTGMYLWSSPFSCYKYDVFYIDSLYSYGATTNFAADFSDLGGVSPLHYEDGVLVQ